MKRVIIIMLIGVCAGIYASMIRRAFGIDKTIFIHGCWMIACFVVIGCVLVNFFYNQFYMNKVKKLLNQLYEGESQEFIDGMKTLLKTAKGQTLRTILLLDLTVGYIEQERFRAAISILEKIPDKNLRHSVTKLVHGINLCISYAKGGQVEKAYALYDKNQALFQKYRNHKKYGANIAILDVIIAISKNQYERAEELLNRAMSIYDSPRFQMVFQNHFDVLNKIKMYSETNL